MNSFSFRGDLPDTDESVVESSEKFLSEGVPDEGSAAGGLGFLGFGGGFFSSGFNNQVGNRFLAVASQVPNSDTVFSGSGDPL